LRRGLLLQYLWGRGMYAMESVCGSYVWMRGRGGGEERRRFNLQSTGDWERRGEDV